MKYDKIGIIAFFLIVFVWTFILTLTLKFILYPENILINRDIDLTIPTMIPVAFNVMSISTFVFINTVYLLYDNKVKRNHIIIIVSKEGFYRDCFASI